jgi:hypothetical protein
MNNTGQINVFFSSFLVYLPTLIVCLVAGVVILIKWRQAPIASLWALLGFGLALVLCFVMPAGQALLQYWVFHGGQRGSYTWALTAFGMVGSVLHAVIYVFLLMAIFTGRSKPDAAIPPTLKDS